MESNEQMTGRTFAGGVQHKKLTLDKPIENLGNYKSGRGLNIFMAETIQVTVTVGDRRVTIEGPEDFVRSEVQRLTNLAVSQAPESRAPGGSEAKAPESERDLIALKKPTGHAEIVTVLGYCLRQAGQNEFTADDIRRAYARVNIRPPKVIDQSLRDAKNLHDYLESGPKRGTFRLSPHGARTVEFDLPRNEQ